MGTKKKEREGRARLRDRIGQSVRACGFEARGLVLGSWLAICSYFSLSMDGSEPPTARPTLVNKRSFYF